VVKSLFDEHRLDVRLNKVQTFKLQYFKKATKATSGNRILDSATSCIGHIFPVNIDSRSNFDNKGLTLGIRF
jgi:hypothetical protein